MSLRTLTQTLSVIALVFGCALVNKAQNPKPEKQQTTDEQQIAESPAPSESNANATSQPAKKKGLFGKLNEKLNKTNDKLQKANATVNEKVGAAKTEAAAEVQSATDAATSQISTTTEAAAPETNNAPQTEAAGASPQPAKKKGLAGKLNEKLNKGKEKVEKARSKVTEVNQQLGGVPLMVINPVGAAIVTVQAATSKTAGDGEESSAQPDSAATDEKTGLSAPPKKKGLFGKLSDKLNKAGQKIEKAKSAVEKQTGDAQSSKDSTPKP